MKKKIAKYKGQVEELKKEFDGLKLGSPVKPKLKVKLDFQSTLDSITSWLGEFLEKNLEFD